MPVLTSSSVPATALPIALPAPTSSNALPPAAAPEAVAAPRAPSDEFSSDSSPSHRQVLGLVEKRAVDLEALAKAGRPVIDSSGVSVMSQGPQAFSRQVIAELVKDGRRIGYTQLTCEKRASPDRYISLVNKKGELVGFALPTSIYFMTLNAVRPSGDKLVSAPEFIEALRKGELQLGPEYFKVYNSTSFSSGCLIGIMQAPSKHEAATSGFRRILKMSSLR